MEYKSQDELARLKCPVLFVHGRHDTLARWAKVEPWTHALANAKLLLLEGGHDIVFTHEQRIVQHLKWWFENTEEPSTVSKESLG
jgi:surfactin synthase thioesterase subunit